MVSERLSVLRLLKTGILRIVLILFINQVKVYAQDPNNMFIITKMNLPFINPTTPVTTTVPPVVNICQNLNTADLVNRLKDTGQFNPTYMASSMEEAADRFPDLTDKHFIRAAEKYTCNAECQMKTDEFLNLLKKKGEPIPPPQKMAKVEQVPFQPLSAAQQNLIFFLGHQQQQTFPDNTGGFPNVNPNFNQQPLASPNMPILNPNPVGNVANPNPVIWNPTGSAQPNQRRRKRQQINALSVGGHNEKMGTSVESLGSSYILYCSPEGYEEKTGFHRMCGACRALRELPEQYFPRFLNEVRCGGTQCIKGHGQCVQKFLNFDILKNEGTKECQRWVPFTVSVSVCCDCLISSQSAIYMQMVRNDNANISIPPRIIN